MGRWTVQEYPGVLVIQDWDTTEEVARVIRYGINEKEWAEEFNTAKLIASIPEIISQRDILLAVAEDLVDLKIYDDPMLLSHLANLVDEAVAAIA